MPLPNTRIIPVGWSEHHRDVVELSANAWVAVIDPTQSTPGEFKDGKTQPPSYHYLVGGPEDTEDTWRGGVPCRLQQLGTNQDALSGDQVIQPHRYLVQLPWAVPPLSTGYKIEVVDAPNEPTAVGVLFDIQAVMIGSESWSRDALLERTQYASTT